MMEENKETSQRDHESSMKGTKDNDLSFKRKAVITCFLAIGYIGTGCAFMIPGPSMIDLEIRTGATTTEISSMFTTRAIGSASGALLAGFVFDALNADVVFIPFYMVSAASIAIAPWWYHSAALSACLGISGFARSFVIVGVNYCCIRFWAPKHAPILLFLAFVKEGGTAMLIPVVRALLIDREGLQAPENVTSHSSLIHNQSELHFNTTMQNIDFQPNDVKVQFAFLIPAFLYVVASLYHYMNIITNGCTLKERKPMTESMELGDQYLKKSRKCKFILLCVIFGTLSVSNGCISEISNMFLFSFAVKYIHWPKADAALLLTAYAFSVSSSPLVFAVLSKNCRPPNSLWIAIIFQVIPISILCTHLLSYSPLLWGAVILFGIGSGSLETLVPSWLASLLGSSGKWPAFCYGNMYLARIGAGWFVGYLFDEYGPIWFVYFLLINVIAFTVAHTFGYILTEVPVCKSNKRKVYMEVETESEGQVKSKTKISEVAKISVL